MPGRKKISVAGYSSCGYFQKAANVAASLEHIFPDRIEAEIIELNTRDAYKGFLPKVYEKVEGSQNHTSSPIVWFDDADFVGGCDSLLAYARSEFNGGGQTSSSAVVGSLKPVSSIEECDYDLVVIGGGSGGLAGGKEASILGAKVAILDFVKPSPQGTKWGLGGTCVNVGCIPKILFHHAALAGETLHDAKDFGWKIENKGHDWDTLVGNIRNYIKSLNFGYKVQLREKGVKYLNSLGSIVDPHTVKCVDKKGVETTITAKRILVAVGGRPNQLECPGGELAITSDDMFYLGKAPGKTLVVGASYVALECASFIAGFGHDTTVMVRSILLRGFDQQMAEIVGKAMEKNGVKFIRGSVPRKLEKLDDGKIKVYWDDGEDVYDTVLAAIGRHADTAGLGLEGVGVNLNAKGKIETLNSQTSVPSIYAIGDCVAGIEELTPVAIALGRNLAHRIYGNEKNLVDLLNVPTAIFAGLEYGCVGLSEDDAKEQYGSNLEVYHTYFTPIEFTVPEAREYNSCYCKVLVDKTVPKGRVLGMHICCPHAGEIIQAWGVGMKLGMTFEDHVQQLIGIHPTIGEEFCLLQEPKSSGKDAVKSGC